MDRALSSALKYSLSQVLHQTTTERKRGDQGVGDWQGREKTETFSLQEKVYSAVLTPIPSPSSALSILPQNKSQISFFIKNS